MDRHGFPRAVSLRGEACFLIRKAIVRTTSAPEGASVSPGVQP